MPRVSIIIPAYNYAHFLPQAIDSALRQSFSDYEVIVVDDGSTDDTPAVAARYAGRIRYHPQANRGLSGARNAGAQMSVGELLAFLDADDTWDKDKLARQVAVFDQNPQAGLVSHLMRLIDREGQVMPGQKPQQAPGQNLAAAIECGTAPPSTFVVRKKVFEAIGGFDESLVAMEDLDFCLRLLRQHALVHVPEVLGSYRIHGPSLSGRPEKIYPCYIRIYGKLFGDGQAPAVRTVVRRKLSRYGYLWAVHQLKNNAVTEGRAHLRRALAVCPWLGWSLEAASPWWVSLRNVIKPYLFLLLYSVRRCDVR